MSLLAKKPWILALGAPLLVGFVVSSARGGVAVEGDALIARDLLGKATQIVARIQKLSNAAKEAKDTLKLNCVNAVLQTAQANFTIADENAKAMAAQPAKATDYREKVEIAYQNLLTAETEANACVGQVTSSMGKGGTVTTIDPNITKQDPTITTAGTPATDGTVRPPETNNCTGA